MVCSCVCVCVEAEVEDIQSDEVSVHHLLEKQEMKEKETYWKTGIKHENSSFGVILPLLVDHTKDAHASILVTSFPDGQGQIMWSGTVHVCDYQPNRKEQIY